ncbi:helix-turn-helix domain-containing protein [Pleomorphovibrio marinus]|uniref:helix-turn-helix domain-containing protein n=1 Tax=Pleomorphovibrio marinus TaxID=2164132 RepID=UPI000E0A5294|nr:helix-turn-helix domain-containing protein [Pleomorphovibrio marinus]
MELSLLLILLLLSISTINGLALVLRGSRGKVKNDMLGAALFFLSLYFLAHFLWFHAGIILDYPHLMRTANPLLFFSGPFFYFFVRNSLFDRKGLEKKDYLHFIPVFLHGLDLMPFYLLDYETKLELAEEVVKNPGNLDLIAHGFLPTDWVNLFMVLLMTVYFIYSLLLLYRVRPDWMVRVNRQKLKDWLFVAVVIFGVFNFSYLGYRVFFSLDVLHMNIDMGVMIKIFTFATLLSIALLNIYVHLRPEYVYQFDDLALSPSLFEPENKTVPLMVEKVGEVTEEEQLIAKRVLDLLEKEECFKQAGLSVLELAATLNVGPRFLSAVCKKCLDKSTKDLINHYRVNFAKDEITSGYLDNYTLDALGKEAGFNSRTTFFNAFKKEFGCGPNEYWKRFQEGSEI